VKKNHALQIIFRCPDFTLIRSLVLSLTILLKNSTTGRTVSEVIKFDLYESVAKESTE
jgi:hypothetical protein